MGKTAFYLALSSMADTPATHIFMLDEMLAARCGKPQSIEHIKRASATAAQPVITAALTAGRMTEARARLASIPCEQGR
jgi:hypothetical protein